MPRNRFNLSAMEPKQSSTPDFSTLTEIMKRFREVPYEQFQQELHAHFDNNFPNPNADLSACEREKMLKFKKDVMRLTDDLFKQAGVVQQCKDLIKDPPGKS